MIKSFKKKIESGFQIFAEKSYDHALIFLILTLGCIVFLFFEIFSLEIDTSPEALLHADDPGKIEYEAFREVFGRPELTIIMIESDDIFSKATLERLVALHKDLEENVPFVKTITSLVNIDGLVFKKGGVVPEPLLAGWPDVNLKQVKKKALSNRLYQNFILSRDGKTTALVIETLVRVAPDNHYFTEKENHQVVMAAKSTMARHQHPDFSLTLSGGPVIADAFNTATLKDLQTCVFFSLIAVLLFSALLFQRVSGVFLSFGITLVTLISTMGLMGLLDIPVKIVTIVVPAFIVAVSVAAGVHLLAVFFRHYQSTGDKRQAIAFAMGHSGLPILMTSLTTAAGLLSFSFAGLGAIEEIGYLSAAGVMMAFVYSICLLPAVLRYLPVRHLTEKKKLSMDRVLAGIARFSCGYPKTIIAVSVTLFFVSLYHIQSLTFSHDLISFFPEDAPQRQDVISIDNKMGGILSIEVLIQPKEKPLLLVDTLNRVDQFCEAVQSIEMEGVTIGKVFAVTDVIKQINQTFNSDISFFYIIPQNQALISKGMESFQSNSNEKMHRFIDSNSGVIRVTIMASWADAMVYNELLQVVREKFNDTFKDGTTIRMTGIVPLLARAVKATIYSMADSYIAAFIVISIMMVLMLGDIKLGLVSMIPNLLPIFLIMGLMGLVKAPFDLNTMMIGSIAIGLVVDDTVHFMYNFQKYHDNTGNVDASVTTTLLGTGKAMLITSCILSCGFFVLLTATLNHVSRFGLFTGLTILCALLGDFLLAPALMKVLYRNKKENAI